MYKNKYVELLRTQSPAVLSNVIFSIYRLNSLNIKFDNDCISLGQLKSKIWLVYQLEENNILDLGTIFLCAGWYGLLANFILSSTKLRAFKVRSFDIDSNVEAIADLFNADNVIDNWKFKAVTQNIHDINYSGHSYFVTNDNGDRCSLFDNPDTIINTSCEHIENFDQWYNKIPDGKLVILQSNNYHDCEGHINTHKTLEEFISCSPMKDIHFSGKLNNDIYDRYMIIGRK